jgi:hypothetical protein
VPVSQKRRLGRNFNRGGRPLLGGLFADKFAREFKLIQQKDASHPVGFL